MKRFKKSDTQRIQVTRSEFRGVELVDIRTVIKKDGEFIMTKMGIQIPVDLYDDFLDYLSEVGIPEAEKKKKSETDKSKKSDKNSKAASKSKPASKEQPKAKEKETVKKRKPIKIDPDNFV